MAFRRAAQLQGLPNKPSITPVASVVPIFMVASVQVYPWRPDAASALSKAVSSSQGRDEAVRRVAQEYICRCLPRRRTSGSLALELDKDANG